MKTFKIAAICFAIIAIIGLISFVAGTRNVNIGAFIFPAILALVMMGVYIRKSKAR